MKINIKAMIISSLLISILFCVNVNAQELEYQTINAYSDNLYFEISGNLPIGAYFTITELDRETVIDCENAINNAVNGGFDPEQGRAYDITLYDSDGNAFQPTDYGEEVQISVIDTNLDNNEEKLVYRVEEIEDNTNNVANEGEYLDPNYDNEMLNAQITELNVVDQAEDTVKFETEHFSTFYIGTKYYNTTGSGSNASVYKQTTFNGITWTLFSDGVLSLTGTATDPYDPPVVYDSAIVGDYNWAYGLNAFTYMSGNSFNQSDLDRVQTVYLDCKMYDWCRGMFASAFDQQYGGSYINKSRPLKNLEYVYTGNNFDFSRVTNANQMFEASDSPYWRSYAGWSKLKKLDGLNKWNTKNLETAWAMFGGLTYVEELDVGQWDTRNLTCAFGMFSGCQSLKSLDCKTKGSYIWNTAKINSCPFMFAYCTSLETLDVSGWNTSLFGTREDTFFIQGGSCLGMFEGCKALKSLDLTSWDMSKANSINSMFSGCECLTEIKGNLNSWPVASYASQESWQSVDYRLGYVFYNCKSLKELDISSWDISAYTHDSILKGCGAFILKTPKKVGANAVDLGDYYYKEPTSGSKRFNNTSVKTIPAGTTSSMTLYRKYEIQYKKPKNEAGSEDPILQQEYICPYSGYPGDTNKKITWLSSTYPEAFDLYTIGDTTTEFDSDQPFDDLNMTKNNQKQVLRGMYLQKFAVTLPEFKLGSQKNKTFSKTEKIKVALKSNKDSYWVSVAPMGTSGTVKLLDGKGHTYNLTVTMPKKKIYYSEVKNNPDIGDGYHETELEVTISGDIAYPNAYSGILLFDITDGVE